MWWPPCVSNKSHDPRAVIEIMVFRLKEGVDDNVFLEADETFRTSFLYRQKGLARATTARGSDGAWLLLTIWSRADAAETAAAAAQDDPIAQAFLDLVDRPTAQRRSYVELD